MKRKLSTAAQAAKAIRTELKTAFPGVKFSVKSDNFSMGNSVDIKWTDGPAWKSVDAITSKYQYGHFDGMTDSYENSNFRPDIPQAKYVHGYREISEEVKEKIREYLISYLVGWEKDANNNSYNETFMCHLSDAIRLFYQDKSIEEINAVIDAYYAKEKRSTVVIEGYEYDIDSPQFKNCLAFNLGFIGHKSEKLQALFSDYSKTPNSEGWLLRFEDYESGVEKGTVVYTNYFENKEAFKEALFQRLLTNL